MKIIRRDYNDYFIVEEKDINICENIIAARYKIKYAKYVLGHKKYVYFTDGCDDIISRHDKQALIKEYKQVTQRTEVNIIKENICDAK
jgi:hypothetical protein